MSVKRVVLKRIVKSGTWLFRHLISMTGLEAKAKRFHRVNKGDVITITVKKGAKS